MEDYGMDSEIDVLYCFDDRSQSVSVNIKAKTDKLSIICNIYD